MAAFSLSLDQVLEEFAMQRGADGRVLERYLRDYPQYARELIDLSQEMFLLGTQGEGPLAVEDQMRIDSAWSRLQSAPRTAPADLRLNLSTDDFMRFARAKKLEMRCPKCRAETWNLNETSEIRGGALFAVGPDGGTNFSNMLVLTAVNCTNCGYVWTMARRFIENWLRENPDGR